MHLVIYRNTSCFSQKKDSLHLVEFIRMNSKCRFENQASDTFIIPSCVQTNENGETSKNGIASALIRQGLQRHRYVYIFYFSYIAQHTTHLFLQYG